MDGGPLLLQPALKVKVWGGRRLEAAGVALPDAQPYGEAWLLHDSATVAQGPLAGRSLGELLRAARRMPWPGRRSTLAAGWPLLAKLLDASAWLSVQVHPDDAWAQRLEDEPRGKTEGLVRRRGGAGRAVGAWAAARLHARAAGGGHP